MCQCPKTGNSHFHEYLLEVYKKIGCVNALRRATLISTASTDRQSMLPIHCVNALRRATLISTR